MAPRGLNAKRFCYMASIRSKGDRLYLVATLPLKDGKDGRKQYKIALHLDDTVQGRRTAARQKATLEASLAKGTFDWADWGLTQGPKKGALTWREAIDRYYEWRVDTKDTKESHWEQKYLPLLSKAPIKMGNICKSADIAEVLASWDRSQDAYMKAHRAFKQLAELADIPFPKVPKPSYRLPQERGEVKAVPTDAEVIDWVLGSDRGQPNGPAYRWFHGMNATYGLRPHETDHVTMLDGDVVQVPWVDKQGRQTKTGFRTVIPVLAEWVDLFGLRIKVERPPSDQEVYRWLRNGLRRHPFINPEWTNYSLRHAYAGRLWRMAGSRLDTYTAARMMGHDPAVHQRLYRHHIEPHEIAKKASEAIDQNLADQQARLQRELQPADQS